MKKLLITFQFLSFIVLGISLIGFLLVSPSILAVGTDKFDLGRWLDADIFLVKFGLILFVIGLLFHLIALIFSLRLKSNYD